MDEKYIGVVGFLELQKEQLVNFLVGADLDYTVEEIYRLSGSGYTAACALNLMGLCTDNELQAIGKMLTYVMEKI